MDKTKMGECIKEGFKTSLKELTGKLQDAITSGEVPAEAFDKLKLPEGVTVDQVIGNFAEHFNTHVDQMPFDSIGAHVLDHLESTGYRIVKLRKHAINPRQ